jgi:hypothetical protein
VWTVSVEQRHAFTSCRCYACCLSKRIQANVTSPAWQNGLHLPTQRMEEFSGVIDSCIQDPKTQAYMQGASTELVRQLKSPK